MNLVDRRPGEAKVYVMSSHHPLGFLLGLQGVALLQLAPPNSEGYAMA